MSKNSKVLALKYRPQTFKDLLGQEIVSAFANNGDFILKKITPYLNINESLQWIGYFSSTGVYGDYKGEWVLSLIHI